MLFEAPSTIDLHDAAAVRFANGATGVFSGSCGVPNGYGFEVDIRIYGAKGSVLLDIETQRLVLKLPDGETRVAEVPKGAWKYSCEGPPDMLVDIALGQGRNESPGETLHAIVASGQAQGAEQIINQTHKAAAE